MRCHFVRSPEGAQFTAALVSWLVIGLVVAMFFGLRWSHVFLLGGVIAGWWMVRCPSASAIVGTVLACFKIAMVSVWVQPLVGLLIGLLAGFLLQQLAMKIRICSGDIEREVKTPRRVPGSGPVPVGAGSRVRLH